MRRPEITVAAMIQQLQAFPPETLVMVDGYEDGVDHAARPRLAYVVRGWPADEDTPFGRFDEVHDEPRSDAKPVVLIER